MNVLFILADQFRADCLGSAGHPVIRTPNLDALAAAGTSFSRAFVQTTPCGPSRMCIYTSRYLCATRAVENETPLAGADENLAMVLREAGSAPAVIGYNDYAIDPRILPADDPRTRSLNFYNFLPGFDVILQHDYDSPEYFASLRRKGYPEELLNHKAIHQPDVPPEGPGERLPLTYPARYREEDSECRFLTDTAIDFVSERQAGSWVLSLNYIKPHPPRICCAPYHEMYDPGTVPPANRREAELDDPHPYLKTLHRDPNTRPEQGLRETRANYYGMISEVDANLGRLFEALKASGQWEDTLILFSSDHGEYLGDHYLAGKGDFYDEALRVPFIVRDPSPAADATRGRRLDGFVEAIDTAPTILEWLGLPIPDWFHGRSVLGRVRARPDAEVRTEIHYEFDFRWRAARLGGIDPERCLLWLIRDDAFKYVQFGDASLPPLLFNLKRDPGEHENLAGRPENAAIELGYCQRLLRWRMKHEDQRMERWASQFR